MGKYDIEYSKWGLLFLPTFWRRPLLTAILGAMMAPFTYLHALFIQFRHESLYRLSHNGQVCYLRVVINDAFDPALRRITVSDITEKALGTTLYMRIEGKGVLLPRRESGQATRFYRRGFNGANQYDFEVRAPRLSEKDNARLRAMINTYKLVSKRFAITYTTTTES